MERSSSVLSASTRGEGLASESAGRAKRREPQRRNRRALSVAQKRGRRDGQTEAELFKSTSLTIRRKIQRISVRHRRRGDQARFERREAAKTLRMTTG